LEQAISMARMHNATLVIGKQDRLSRNVHFISGLLESGIDFVSADRPDQTKQETLFRALIDEEEADRISARTKAGLQIAKEKGVKLGSARSGHWDGREHLRGYRQATAASAVARKQRVREAYKIAIELIVKWRAKGVPYDVIAEKLNALGHVTLGKKPFKIPSVLIVMRLFGRKPDKQPYGYGICSKCNRKFKVVRQEKQDQAADCPLICHRCEKETIPAWDANTQICPLEMSQTQLSPARLSRGSSPSTTNDTTCIASAT
jgi:hypothetical protein